MKATRRNLIKVAKFVGAVNCRDAWSKGVKDYAFEMIAYFDEWRKWNEDNGESVPELDEVTALNGARDWSVWAWSGCGLIYDAAIAERLCTPSELRKTAGGQKKPNAREEWLDVEARAARQAWQMIAQAVRKLEA